MDFSYLVSSFNIVKPRNAKIYLYIVNVYGNVNALTSLGTNY